MLQKPDNSKSYRQSEQGLSEQGLADFEAPTWFAVFLPRGASEPIIRKLNQAAFATADTPSVQERLNVLAAPIHRGADFGG